MKLHRQIINELIGQQEIEIFIHQRAKPRKERKTASEMKTFQRYLSSINKGSIVEVLDLPAAVLDHLLAKFFYRHRKTDGDDYEPDTLSHLQQSIQWFLSKGRSPFTVLSPFKRQLVTSEQYSSHHLQQILLL